LTKRSKQLSNSFSTGGGGSHFEAHVQASFVTLMLTGGFAPCLPCWPIKKIKLQGKFAGYDTDDLIIFVDKSNGNEERKILGQIKHTVSITEKDKTFGEVIQAAWNDFNNTNLFCRGKDVIALITGPLSSSDINDVRTILEWARHSENADEFINKVQRANFSSKNKQKKLQAFRTNLQKANNGSSVSDETLFEFLKHFHLLGYDLDIKAGVTLSLLHSHIGQFSQENSHSLWTQIVDVVQSANKNAGTISLDTLPIDLKEAFKPKPYEVIPPEFTKNQLEPVQTDWNQLPFASDLAIVNLIGQWDEKCDDDIAFVRQLIKVDYGDWIRKIREILQIPNSPISLKDGLWQVTDRKKLWNELGSRLFDEQLDDFKECAVAVLTEHDPKFDLPVNDRYAAIIYDKKLKHSSALRVGIAESLALLGNQPDDLINCARDKPETTATLVIRKSFESADWILWGSLNGLLPVLAEAAPDEFLYIVEKTLLENPRLFDELFAQEGDGITGINYLTGILWALETLAWEEKFLVRVCAILGELTARDPGGRWGNRPANSLKTILLPWLPQTNASIEKRKAALITLQKEVPEIAWKLLLELLPGQGSSMGTHKPSWRNSIPSDWKKGVTPHEYWEQVNFYAELAVAMASQNIGKMNEIVEHLDKLPLSSFNKILEDISSEYVSSKPEEDRLKLWNKLTGFASRHRLYHDTEWALSSELVSKIEAIVAKLAPENPLNLYHRLFSDRGIDLYEDRGSNWEEQRLKLEERRQKAIEEIFGYGGIDSVIRFVESVESPRLVGQSLAEIADTKIDAAFLPEFLGSENIKLKLFISGYVWSRHFKEGYVWADGLSKASWTITQIADFLSYLPFSEEVWNRVNLWLVDSESEYWNRVNVYPYGIEGDINFAIDKLIEYGRPFASIDCLWFALHKYHALDKARSVTALIAALSSKEPPNRMDSYHIIEIIKALQSDPSSDPDDLFRVEWAYLPLLDRYNGVSPKTLENRLASDPEFFCEVIRLIYRSKNEDKPEKEGSEQDKAIATNAWQLLHDWRTPPGTRADGSFCGKEFLNWLEMTQKICTDSGHLDIAYQHIGHVLFYCPPDPQGLWIDQNVAAALNDKAAEHIRTGFSSEIFNSRGAYCVDPTGKPERELAEQYRQKADEVENAGYQRFAATLRSRAEYYEQEADRIRNGKY
jgi:hypothetical protein